ncbi:type II toxin-antitoxin system YafQ family toxin [Actinomyces bovis]|uniref:type II toxin-antitoxin system YafQ family toxin n=1 Tax=Actinomyces bovis TaxID=1658 RepID=UPI0038994F2B
MKRLKKKHVNLDLLKGVLRLVLAADDGSLAELRRRHHMHELKGEWHGARECHV